jgi:glutamate-ammonia-ligase adenylyltransferase
MDCMSQFPEMIVPVDRIEKLPALLRDQVQEWWAQLRGQLELSEETAARLELPRVWAASEFVARSCLLEPALLEDIAGTLERPDAATDMRARLRARLEDVADADALGRELRRFRRREMIRIAWRDLAGWAALEETLNDLSELAEVCIDEALARLYDWQCRQWGTPRSEEGEPQQLVVLGMGKLGGRELNFSSDIDLIFAFPESGAADGPKGKSNEEFFTTLGRRLIAALDTATADGFVFRVDMRLRPYGNSGPLVMSFGGMETYYQSQGREWERYAMIKARVVGGDRARGDQLLEALRPFVYRRYLDYGALESLREMKGMIVREVARRGMEGNIKLGRGGIREIEFIGQAFQLIRGGRDPNLRQRSILPVLRYLGEEGLLPARAAEELIQAYGFLRRTENRLQAMADRQTHDLPTDSIEQARLALAMDSPDWAAFCRRLDGWRRKVQGQFDQVFVAPQAQGGPSPAGAGGDDLGDAWLTELDDAPAAAALQAAGFADPAEGWRRLKTFRNGPVCRSLSASGRRRLDRLMPLLLAAAARSQRPDAALVRLLEVVEAIARRTAYLALLVENPMALSQLVQLCAASPWIARYLARHPLLLDELLDPRTLYVPLGQDALRQELAQRLDGIAEDDLEQQMEVLRHFKQTNTLRVAAADITGAVPLMVVSDYLTYLAEAVLDAVLRLAHRQMTARYRPAAPPAGSPGIAAIAYGKLGGIELGYGSDLDLVFLHEDTGDIAESQAFFGRITQRVIHILGTTTPGGILYEADTRLRPSGKGGLLSSTLPAFAEYQRTSAWTWEHQALVRARVVAGDGRLAAGFEQVRWEILRRARDRDRLRREVRDMRRRQLAEKGGKDPARFDLKNDRGGIADIEFLVQYGVLSRAADHPGLVRHTDNIRLLDELSDTGWISADEARLLADAYRAFRSRLHRLTLQEEPGRVAAAELVDQRALVAELWQRLME